jgi:two-component system LytT family response regulator
MGERPPVGPRLRVVIADDERPARSFLAALLRSFDLVVLVGEADSGKGAVELIEREKPDLALLDVQMPELDGLGVVRALKKGSTPLIAFVTAHDEYAIRAFELNAVDYLLKPVERTRLHETLTRAHERNEHAELVTEQVSRVNVAADMYDSGQRRQFLERIPVRRREEVTILPVGQVASIVADGELLHLTTIKGDRYTITYRLKDLEARLDPARFLRLGRGILANIDLITKVSVMPGGTYEAVLSTGQRLPVSRLRSRSLRTKFLRL